MKNMNSIPQGRVLQTKMQNGRSEEVISNPIIQQKPHPPKFESVSKEYADAVRSLAMSHIKLGNIPEYYSPDTIYKHFRR